jgi:acetylornithine deacetylase
MLVTFRISKATNHRKYLYDPGSIHVAHSDHEHIKVADLEIAVEAYMTLIIEVLKNKSSDNRRDSLGV